MPSYPFLFDVKDKLEPGDIEVMLPRGFGPVGKVVVPKAEANDLVVYLKALNRAYPVLPAPPAASASAAAK